MIQLARRAQDLHGLRRYSFVSTVAVAGKRQNEVVGEDSSIDWTTSDYDPYARTSRNLPSTVVNQLLPDAPHHDFPSGTRMGDTARDDSQSIWSRHSTLWPVFQFFHCGPDRIISISFLQIA
jgi:hypothetical protein